MAIVTAVVLHAKFVSGVPSASVAWCLCAGVASGKAGGILTRKWSAGDRVQLMTIGCALRGGVRQSAWNGVLPASGKAGIVVGKIINCLRASLSSRTLKPLSK